MKTVCEVRNFDPPLVTRLEVCLAPLAQNAIKSRTPTINLSDVAEIYKRVGILLLSTQKLLAKDVVMGRKCIMRTAYISVLIDSRENDDTRHLTVEKVKDNRISILVKHLVAPINTYYMVTPTFN